MDIDTQLIHQIAKREHDALAQLYERHVMQMLAIAHRILKSRKDAEDLIHDVFLEIWDKAADFDASRSSVRTWILMRVRSRAIDRLRQRVRSQNVFSAEGYDESEAIHTGPTLDQLVEWQCTRSAVERLPKSQHTVIVLSYFEGLTCTEIAKRCRIPVGTVKSRLSAAIRHLRNTLESSGEKTHVQSR